LDQQPHSASHLLLCAFHHTAPPEIYTLSLHDALPIFLAQDTKEKKIKFTSKLKALQLLKRHFKPEEAPEGMGLSKMLKILNRMFTKGDKAGAAEFSWSTMYVGGMHFQDNYNYDIERVK